MIVDRFLRYIRYERNYSSHTVLSYDKDLQHFNTYVVDNTTIQNLLEVDTDIVRMYIAYLMQQGFASSTVSQRLSAIKSLYKFAVKQGDITVSPVDGVKRPKGEKTLPVFLKQRQIDTLLDTQPEENSFLTLRDRLIVSMLYHTGMRRQELITLRDCDIDSYTNTIKVTGKRDKQRIIPFGNELKIDIAAYKEVRNREVSLPESFFVRDNGEPLYPQLVYRVVKSALSEVTTQTKRSPHVLRHTFATSMLNEGANLNGVKELLGHGSLSSTQVYTHVTFEELKKSYNNAHPRGIKKRR